MGNPLVSGNFVKNHQQSQNISNIQPEVQQIWNVRNVLRVGNPRSGPRAAIRGPRANISGKFKNEIKQIRKIGPGRRHEPLALKSPAPKVLRRLRLDYLLRVPPKVPPRTSRMAMSQPPQLPPVPVIVLFNICKNI